MRLRSPMIVLILVSALTALGGPATAEPVRFGPEPSAANLAGLRAVNPLNGLLGPFQVGPIADGGVVVDFDPAGRVLRFDSVSVDAGPMSFQVGRGDICLRNLRYQLPEGVAPPTAPVDAVGRFSTSFPVVVTYDIAIGLPFCSRFEPGALTATWDLAGLFRTNPASGRTRLTEVMATVGNSSDTSLLAEGRITLNLWDGFGIWDGFGVVASQKFQRVGDVIRLVGNDITPGTILKVYLNTPEGTRDMVPDGLAPTATTPATWESVLPWPWPLPAPDNVQLGLGFLSAHLVRTDRGFDRSNAVTRVLVGNSALGVPGIEQLGPSNGPGTLAPFSWSPAVAVAHVERVLIPGQSAFIGGSFAGQDPVVVIFAPGDCTPLGGIAPTSLGETLLEFTVPAGCPVGTGAFQVVNRQNFLASNIVYAALGDVISVHTVTLRGRTVEVTGTGFNRFTTINLFATRRGTQTSVNFGGLLPDGQARIPLTSVTPTALTFELPDEAAGGRAFVQALNPPFIPFTSSLSRSDGSFVIP